MLSVEEARRKILALIEDQPAETVALTAAHGRVLAADVVAARPQPPFTASAMDGYAVRAADAAEGAALPVVAHIAAGHGSDAPLAPGTAVRLFTGAPVPAGADAILIQENAASLPPAADGTPRIRVTAAPEPGVYLRPAGGDFAAGARLAAPRRLDARSIALAAAMGADRLSVARRPVVALLPTGDELVAPGSTPRGDQIFASNNYGLAAMVEAAGAVPRLCPIAADTPEGLLAALAEAHGADILVTLGGASVGEHDLVARVLGGAGLTLDFHRIAMRPGKPLMAGRLVADPGEPAARGATMLGLPGNPVSAMVCGLLFLLPAIERAMGLPGDPPPRRAARLAAPIGRNGPREHYMRAARVGHGEDGLALVRPAENQDSSLLHVLADA
ncbi:MAG: gephyrin-like molybdotransferase Glp, partial [Pseudomonadota bacterium]